MDQATERPVMIRVRGGRPWGAAAESNRATVDAAASASQPLPRPVRSIAGDPRRLASHMILQIKKLEDANHGLLSIFERVKTS